MDAAHTEFGQFSVSCASLYTALKASYGIAVQFDKLSDISSKSSFRDNKKSFVSVLKDIKEETVK